VVKEAASVVQAAWQRFLSSFRRAAHSFESERSDKASSFELLVDVRRDDLDGGYVAEVVDMPGVMSQGDTEEEALENVVEAWSEVVTARLARQFTERSSMDSGGVETVRYGVSAV